MLNQLTQPENDDFEIKIDLISRLQHHEINPTFISQYTLSIKALLITLYVDETIDFKLYLPVVQAQF